MTAPVFDAHIHIQPWEMLKPEVRATMALGHADFDELCVIMREPNRLLARMDLEGISRVAMINYVSPDLMGFTEEVNAWVARYAAAEPSRLLPVGGIDPRRCRNPERTVGECIETHRLRMIKVHPSHQLTAPNAYLDGNRALEVLYRRCEEAGVPVMIHTGTSIFPGARNKFADPMLCDDVAVDFPRLKIVLAHGGRPIWMESAVFLVRRHLNVHLDLSGIPPQALREYFPKLETIADKVLWGTDWPAPRVPGMGANLAKFHSLGFPAPVERKILWENAVRLFGA
ncbi:MAG: amidohydrolase [Planctomycetes bacterium]|nr:amidohydrolase [Planctomycetota bacterium]